MVEHIAIAAISFLTGTLFGICYSAISIKLEYKKGDRNEDNNNIGKSEKW